MSLRPAEITRRLSLLDGSITFQQAAKKLKLNESTLRMFVLKARAQGHDVSWASSRHRLLRTMIPELLSRPMRFGELLEEIHNSYGSANIRTIHRYVAKLVDDGIIVRGGTNTNNSFYVIAAKTRSRR